MKFTNKDISKLFIEKIFAWSDQLQIFVKNL